MNLIQNKHCIQHDTIIIIMIMIIIIVTLGFQSSLGNAYVRFKSIRMSNAIKCAQKNMVTHLL